MSPARQSPFEKAPSNVQLRGTHERRYNEQLPYDSNIEHGITFMEKVVRQKNYQINQRSLALTGRIAIDDRASVNQATMSSIGSPHKTIVNPFKGEDRDEAPNSEFKKTQCNITRFVKGLKDTRIQTMNNMSILRPNIR